MLSPPGVQWWGGGQYQCKTMKCRKVFNIGNCAYISVREAGEVEGRRHSLGIKVI